MFEVKVSYTVGGKKKSDVILQNGDDYRSAGEAVVNRIRKEYEDEELEIKTPKLENKEYTTVDPVEGSNWEVGFIMTEIDDNGNEKDVKSKALVGAETAFDAMELFLEQTGLFKTDAVSVKPSNIKMYYDKLSAETLEEIVEGLFE